MVSLVVVVNEQNHLMLWIPAKSNYRERTALPKWGFCCCDQPEDHRSRLRGLIAD